MIHGFKCKGSITRRLVIIILSVALLTGAVGYTSFLVWYMAMQQERITSQANTVALVLSQDLARLALLKDLAVAADISTKLESFGDLEALVFYQIDRRPTYQFHRQESFTIPELPDISDVTSQREGANLYLFIPVIYENLVIGTVFVSYRLDTLIEVLKRDSLTLLAISLFMVPFSLMLAVITGKRFTRPILSLVGFLEKIEETDQMSARISIQERNEFGKLFAEVNTMLERLESSQQEQRLAAVAFETPSGMFITDAKEHILRVNHAFTSITGYAEEEVIGKTPAILKSGYHDQAFYLGMYHELQRNHYWSGEVWNRHKNGELYPELLTIHAVLDDQQTIQFYVAAFNDLTRLKEAESRLRYLSLHDALTGLPNRLHLEQELQRFLDSGRKRQLGAVFCVNIDGFRSINEAQGHVIGDKILIETARRLVKYCDQARLICRWGSDEFVIWFPDVGNNSSQVALDMEQLSQTLHQHLSDEFRIEEISLRLKSRIGVSLYDHDDRSADDIIQQSTSALQQARADTNRRIVFYDERAEALTQRYIKVYQALLRAQQNKEFMLYYQVQTDAERNVIGAEALLRWYHPEMGFVSPAEFIPVAERSDLIVSIGKWVLQTACQQLKTWSAIAEYQHLVLAVNVSGLQISKASFVNDIKQLILTHQINPERLKLELTESLLVEQIDQVSLKIIELREMGVQVSLDDFGTGYSSLAYLKHLPVSQIKIDQSFVKSLTSGSGEEAIVRTVLSLGGAFNFEVIAEGVETEKQFELLKSLGCKLFQGYLLGHPKPLSDDRLIVNS